MTDRALKRGLGALLALALGVAVPALVVAKAKGHATFVPGDQLQPAAAAPKGPPKQGASK